MTQLPTLEILGLPIARAHEPEALAEVERLYAEAAPAVVAFANAHTLNLAAADPDYLEVLRHCDVVFNDGSGVAMAGRLRRRPFPTNLNGSDLSPLILELAARNGWRVFLLGSKQGVAERAGERLRQRLPSLEIAGCHHGYFSPDQEQDVAEKVRVSGADVVFAAMGNPNQEVWLDAHLAATGARLGVGVGAFLDFASGTVPRAPAWMNRLGVEWTFRLAVEPGRLWRRYMLGIPLFLSRVVRERLGTR